MGRFWLKVAAVLLFAGTLAGCTGSKSTGKYGNLDKPRPADSSGY